jgi:hypothetical protein
MLSFSPQFFLSASAKHTYIIKIKLLPNQMEQNKVIGRELKPISELTPESD